MTLPSTARMIIDTKRLTHLLRVKELRGLASGLREKAKGRDFAAGLAKILSEVAEDLDQLSGEWFSREATALETVEAAKGHPFEDLARRYRSALIEIASEYMPHNLVPKGEACHGPRDCPACCALEALEIKSLAELAEDAP